MIVEILTENYTIDITEPKEHTYLEYVPRSIVVEGSSINIVEQIEKTIIIDAIVGSTPATRKILSVYDAANATRNTYREKDYDFLVQLLGESIAQSHATEAGWNIL